MLSAVLIAFFLNIQFVPINCDCDLNKFNESGIVPNIVPDVPEILKVSYPDKPVDCGDEVDIKLTKNPPLINYTAVTVGFHALVMLDPDAPDPHRPVFAHFLHWFVVNIPGNRLDRGKELKPYMQPSPPPYSAAHRYILIVFRQKSYVEAPSYMMGKGRSRFNLTHMEREMGMRNVVAANFFYTHK